MNRVFLITPGRSGTYWVSALMLAATNLPLTGNPEFFPYEKIEPDSKRIKKLSAVLSRLPEQYVCTSLLPRVCCLDLLIEKKARFIHLKRNIKDNAYSMYRMEFTPGRAQRGKWYHPDPEAAENIIKLYKPSSLTDYQLCLWACVETRAVAKKIKSLGLDVFEFDICEINNPDDHTLLTEFLEWVGVEYDLDRAKVIVGKKINSLERYSSLILPPIEESARRKQEEGLLGRLKEQKGITEECVDELERDLGL